mmetsp:Transcript_105781/g.330857  ORF Transcript_105781/g.330857 Transcript_105781/m.330857 type:complete len:238 (+) Transcript_105781:1586-2299(+)
MKSAACRFLADSSWRLRGRMRHWNVAMTVQKLSMHCALLHSPQFWSVRALATVAETTSRHSGCARTDPGLMREHNTEMSKRGSTNSTFTSVSSFWQRTPQSSSAAQVSRNMCMFGCIALKKLSQYSCRKLQPTGQSLNCPRNKCAMLPSCSNFCVTLQTLTSSAHSTKRRRSPSPKLARSLSCTYAGMPGPARHVHAAHHQTAARAPGVRRGSGMPRPPAGQGSRRIAASARTAGCA